MVDGLRDAAEALALADLAEAEASRDVVGFASAIRRIMEWPQDAATMAHLSGRVMASGLTPIRIHLVCEPDSAMMRDATVCFAAGDGLLASITQGHFAETPPGDAAFVVILPPQPYDQTATEMVAGVQALSQAAQDAGAGHVLIADWPAASIASSIADRAAPNGSAARTLQANLALREALQAQQTQHVLDRSGTASAVSGPWADPRLSLMHGGPAPGAGAAFALGREISRWVRAATGRARKLIVTDLDGVLWGGVLGEDGFNGVHLGPDGPGAAYQMLQRHLAAAHRDGAMLGIVSRNAPSDVEEMLSSHPGMVLRRDQFSAVHAGWRPKTEVIHQVAEQLSAAPNAVLVLDDDPTERLMIRGSLPEVTVPDSATDPLALSQHLQCMGWTDDLTTTAEDRLRTSARATPAKAAKPADLATLQMHGTILTGRNIPVDRALQLARRVTQFNATGRSLSADRLANLTKDDDPMAAVLHLTDHFSDLGRIGLVALQRDQDDVIITDLLISCRALQRGVDTVLLNWAAGAAREQGAIRLIGEIVETPRNLPVRDLYQRHGFDEVADQPGRWSVPLTTAPVFAPHTITLD